MSTFLVQLERHSIMKYRKRTGTFTCLAKNHTPSAKKAVSRWIDSPYPQYPHALRLPDERNKRDPPDGIIIVITQITPFLSAALPVKMASSMNVAGVAGTASSATSGCIYVSLPYARKKPPIKGGLISGGDKGVSSRPSMREGCSALTARWAVIHSLARFDVYIQLCFSKRKNLSTC